MFERFSPFLRRLRKYLQERRDLSLIRASGLFDASSYLASNPDIAGASLNPLLHYLRYGGFEGRDSGSGFSSKWYLGSYRDVMESGTNPLVHYLKYGQKEGRLPLPPDEDRGLVPYACPVCGQRVAAFKPLDPYYEENKRKYGNLFTFDDVETINPTQYQCPYCGASDRDRLYALYLGQVLSGSSLEEPVALLDIAPSLPLKNFLRGFPINYLSADKFMDGVDLVLDIMDMVGVQSASFDFFICSHVLEHVADDRQALAELFRILKPGGSGILMVPINLSTDQIDEEPGLTDIAERWRRFGQDDHIRLYSKQGFLKRVAEAGFTIDQLGSDYFGQEEFLRSGISKKSILYVVSK
jgi:hypothetical protein